MKNRVSATLQEVENVVREVILPTGSTIEKAVWDDQHISLDFWTSYVYQNVNWGYVLLSEQHNKVTFQAKLNHKTLMKFCDGDLDGYENFKELYQVLLNKLTIAILKKFKKPKKQWESLKPETKRVYTEAWNIYLVMHKEYALDVLDNRGTVMKPDIADWQTRVTQKVKKKSGEPWTVTERTLETVKSYGEAGDIPKTKPKRRV